MARRLTAAFAALALGALAGCADSTAPAAPAAPAGGGVPAPSFSRSVAGDLPVLETARALRVEPLGFPADKFDITLRFASPVTPGQRAAFETAAARWQMLIDKDMQAVGGSFRAGACFPGMPAFSGVIDDILIDVQLVPIDGPGKIAGAASACFVRSSDGLPVYGFMYFDVADLDFLEGLGLLDETVVHEMGHVLGLSSYFWEQKGLSGGAADYHFTGKYANLQYAEAGGLGLVPIEDMFGPGTRGSHWRESAMDAELMTGFLNRGANPLSRITAGALRDLGYRTNMAAEEYAVPPADVAAAPMGAGTGTDALVSGVDIAGAELLYDPIARIVTEQ